MNRQLQQLIPSQETSDGAGVRIKRSIGKHQHARFDPFLMLDEFGSASANDYIAGFPNHPHRGFETVTYMLQGHMLHEDHLGNRGNLQNGDVQWMTAGRGIIHSEMPQQEEGLMRGFQLWLNLPAAEKMKPASYKDIPAAQIPVTELANGGCVKVIANKLTLDDKTISGPIQGCTTDPYYWDVHLPKGGEFAHAIPSTHNVFIYVYEGGVAVGDDARETPKGHAGILSGGDAVSFKALSDDTRFILLAGIPIREPIAQYGPFVMNTPDEIEQAIQDYRSGALINY